jgi:hypothetical protein
MNRFSAMLRRMKPPAIMHEGPEGGTAGVPTEATEADSDGCGSS